MSEKISISIPLSGKTLEFIINLLENLERKFSIKFIKSKKARPHINLISGKTNNLNKIVSVIKENLYLSYHPELKLLGLGAFISHFPTIYLRFEIVEYLIFLRKVLFKKSNLWDHIDESVKDNMWFPKSSIIHKDMDVGMTSDVIKYLNLQTLPESMMIKEISIINFSDIEKEVESFKLNI